MSPEPSEVFLGRIEYLDAMLASAKRRMSAMNLRRETAEREVRTLRLEHDKWKVRALKAEAALKALGKMDGPE